MGSLLLLLLLGVALCASVSATAGTQAFSIATPSPSPCQASAWVGTADDDTAVFFTTIEPDNLVYRIDGSNGEIQWETSTGSNRSGMRSSPIYANDLLHVGLDNGTYAAFNASTGNVHWTYTSEDEAECWDPDLPTHYRPCEVYSSALVVDGLRIQGSEDNHTRCFNASTGELLWKKPAGGNVDATAVVGAFGTNSIWIGCDDGYLYNLDLSTGNNVLPPVKHNGIMESQPSTDPSTNRLFSMYRPTDSKTQGVVFALDMSTGAYLWSISCAGGVPLYVAKHDAVFVAGENGTVFAANSTNGEILWSQGDFPAVARFMGPVAYDTTRDLVYGGNFHGLVCALNATTGAIVWTYQLPTSKALIPVPLGPRISKDNSLLYFGSYDGSFHAVHLE